MNFGTVFHILGILLMLFSTTLVLPILIALYTDALNVSASFGFAFFITLLTGIALTFVFDKNRRELQLRDGFLLTMLFWTVLSAFAAIPIYLADPTLSFIDAYFESVSGFTTTGATVIDHIDSLPWAVRFYRQFLQWLGGIGIVVLAIAVLPMLGIGGMQLYKSEVPGPIKDSKLKPRITQTAKTLWYIYLVLTVACALSYYVAGMNWFDAIIHSFSTVSIGGFSSYDQSIGHFDSLSIEIVAIVFMLVSALNFALHYTTWSQRSLTHYIHDSEICFFVFALVAVTSFVIIVLIAHGNAFGASIRMGIFQTVSLITTTGLTTEKFSTWPLALPTVLILVAFIGGCAGSTSGGIKSIRVLLLFKQLNAELKRLAHPNCVFTVRLGNRKIPSRVIESIWAFFFAYIFIYATMSLLLLMFGLDYQTAFSAVAANINNLGPGLGDVAANYKDMPSAVKLILCACMLLGRLELFTMLVLLTRHTWRY